MRGVFVLAALGLVTACSSADDSHVTLDFSPIRNSARAIGQRIDAGFVFMTTGGATTESDVDMNSLEFDITLNVGDDVRFEASTCLGSEGACVTNYWGAASATLQRTATPVVIDIFQAGQLVVDVKRFDGQPVPEGVELELRGANPHGGLTVFTVHSGDKRNLPVDTYTASVSNDAGLTLDLDPVSSVIAMTHGSSLNATVYFGSCTGAEDPDGDRIPCSSDCDESSAACGYDCSDSDNDGTPDCRDTCIDNDRDGYGVGATCAGADCDDTRAEVAPDQKELCDTLDNDCNPATTETVACETTTDPCQTATATTLQLGARQVCNAAN